MLLYLYGFTEGHSWVLYCFKHGHCAAVPVRELRLVACFLHVDVVYDVHSTEGDILQRGKRQWHPQDYIGYCGVLEVARTGTSTPAVCEDSGDRDLATASVTVQRVTNTHIPACSRNSIVKGRLHR
jgi:hypothetical protein